MSDVRVETTVINSYSGLEALKEQWLSLLDRCRQRTFFSTWEWMTTIGEHYGSELSPFTIAVFEDGQLIGIAPLAVVKRWGLLRVVRFLGAGPFGYSIADYQDFIMADGREKTVVQAVLAELVRHSDGWDVVDLQEIRGTSSLVPLLVEEADRNGLRTIEEVRGACYPVPLPDDWDKYLATLSRRMRSSLRRRMRKITRECSARYERIQDEAKLVPAMDALVNLHTARWRSQGLPGIFALDGLREFHEALARKLLAKGWLDLVVMYANDRPVGASYNFRYDDVVYNYIYGYEPARIWDKYSLGSLLSGYVIKSAIEDGFREFDFLRGHGDYKMDYAASKVRQVRFRMLKSGSLFYAYLGLRCLRSTARKVTADIRRYRLPIPVRRAEGRCGESLDEQGLGDD